MTTVALLSCWIFGVCISGYLSPNILVFIFPIFLLSPLFLWQWQARKMPHVMTVSPKRIATMLLCILIALSGYWYQNYREERAYKRAVTFCQTNPTVLEGVIVSDVSRYNSTDYCYVKLENGLKTHIKIRTDTPLVSGQRVRLWDPTLLAVNIKNHEIARTESLLGNGASLSATFPYEATYQVTGIGNSLLYYAKQWRNQTKNTFSSIFSKDVAAFLTALISSDKSALDDELYQSFIETGTVHIVVVSGMHFNYLASALLILLGIFCHSRRQRLILCFPVLLLFCLFTGGTIPVLRSFLMITAVFFCDWFYLDRQNTCTVILLLAAAFLAVQPSLVYHPSFLLSFGAALGLACFSDPFEQYLHFIPWAYLRSYLATYFAVQIFTLPTVCFFFARIPIISLIANFLVGPLVAPILLLGIPVLLLHNIPLISTVLIGLTEQISRAFLWLITQMASWLSPVSFPLTAVSYLCLLGGGMSGYFAIRSEQKKRIFPLMLTAFFLVSALFLPLFPHRNPHLLITFMGATNTNSATITTNNGRLILIGTAEDIFYGQRTAAYRESSPIPLVVLTGVSQEEHLQQFLSTHRVDTVIVPIRYREMISDCQNFYYLTQSAHLQIDGIDIRLIADKDNLYETELTYQNNCFSFCMNAAYLEKLLQTDPSKTIFFNFKRTGKATERIGKLKLTTPLYSKKPWHPKETQYNNYSIFIADADGIHSPSAKEREP